MEKKKRVVICGVDGYLGWTLAVYLRAQGYDVAGIDNFHRRDAVAEVGSQSAIPLLPLNQRGEALKSAYPGQGELVLEALDLLNFERVREFFRDFEPDVVVHLAQNPSAPYSMATPERCFFVAQNNIMANLSIIQALREMPDVNLVKLGTMGEYGTPNVDIPEGEFHLEFRGRVQKCDFPRKPGSWYHATKVCDTVHMRLACEVYGLRGTDIQQGVVFGVDIPEMKNLASLFSRFDFDEAFGTAINRFVAQAIIEAPLTVYGEGKQKRGFLPIGDAMKCLKIAIDRAPAPGEYRVWNQFESVWSIRSLAELVSDVAFDFGIKARISLLKNPRKEAAEHYYNPDRQKLMALGYIPNKDIRSEVARMFQRLLPFRDRIESCKQAIEPSTDWKEGAKK